MAFGAVAGHQTGLWTDRSCANTQIARIRFPGIHGVLTLWSLMRRGSGRRRLSGRRSRSEPQIHGPFCCGGFMKCGGASAPHQNDLDTEFSGTDLIGWAKTTLAPDSLGRDRKMCLLD